MSTAESSGSIPLGSSTMESFAALIGEDAAVSLSMHFGGRQVYVPHEPRPGSELVVAVGIEAARKLAKRYRGLSVLVPISAGKRARIIRMWQGDRTFSDIAKIVGCTERHAYQVVADFKETGGSIEDRIGTKDRHQLGLFEPTEEE